MSHSPVLTIAGVAVRLTLPRDDWWDALAPRLGHFEKGTDAPLALAVTLDPAVVPEPPGEPTLTAEEAGVRLRFDHYDGLVSPDGQAVLRIGEEGPAPTDLTYVMAVDSLLRIQLAQRLAQMDGLLMHAAGIEAPDGRAHVFFGPSGSGKTTMCRLSSPRLRVLCDEVVAIRLDGPEPTLHGTPFSGAWGHSLAESCPLAGLHRLRHAPETRRQPLQPGAAIREILESTVYYDQSPTGLSRALALSTLLAQAVPVDELLFEPEEKVWEILASPRQTSPLPSPQ